MARYNGLIIPRSYNDYFARSDPQAIQEVVRLATDEELDAESANPIQNQAVAKIVPEGASEENQLATESEITTIEAVIPNAASVNNKLATNEQINSITGLIPTQATETNQLADKDFVNSSISTNTAHYIYKTNEAGDKLPFDSVEELEAYTGTVTQNDYAVVTGVDGGGNTYYDRYKADIIDNVVSWGKEYRINNSSFTSEQWAAIQSGITAELVEKIGQASGSSPIGTILQYIDSTPPAGFLLFNGNEYKGEDYPQLYEKVKNLPAFASSQSGYFKLPNLAGRVLQGATLENLGTLIEAGLPNITGNTKGSFIVFVDQSSDGCISPNGTSGSGYSWNGGYIGGTGFNFDATLGETKLDGTLRNDVYGKSDTVQPPAFTVNYIIKATNTSDDIDGIIDDSTNDVGHAWSGAKVKSEITAVDNKNNYSTEETVVGKWIDGKPIYRKVIKQDTNISSRMQLATNVNELINVKGYAENSQWTLKAILPWFYSSQIITVDLNGNIVEFRYENVGVSRISITIEYTKTTD